MFDDIIKVFIL